MYYLFNVWINICAQCIHYNTTIIRSFLFSVIFEIKKSFKNFNEFYSTLNILMDFKEI